MNYLCAFIGIVITLSISPAWASDLPDSSLTPGAINPEVTQGNIQQTVCVKGFTKTIFQPRISAKTQIE